jgi:hypothetical protein
MLFEVTVFDAEASTGWEVLPTLPALIWLVMNPPGGGRDLSFLSDCPSLTGVFLQDCNALSDLSALVSVSRLGTVGLWKAKHLRDLHALTELPNLKLLDIRDAPLAAGLAAVTPILDRLEKLRVFSVPTVTSLGALAGSSLVDLTLSDCPVADLEPLATLQSLTEVWLLDLPAVNLAPLATLPHLRELHLTRIEEPVDLSPLTRTRHRLHVELWNTSTVGTAGPLVKIRRY